MAVIALIIASWIAIAALLAFIDRRLGLVDDASLYIAWPFGVAIACAAVAVFVVIWPIDRLLAWASGKEPKL